MTNLSPLPISFEFFPPQSAEGLENLKSAQVAFAQTLASWAAAGLPINPQPEYFSVTYGAGGSTREKTWAAVQQAKATLADIPVAPHITCVGARRADIAELLAQYQENGINRLVVLRGDLPSGAMGQTAGEFQHAIDLVRFIRAETGKHFHLSVAAYPEMHPEAANLAEDMRHFVAKVEAGADLAITQFFFNAEAYAHFVDSVQRMGVRIPIVPGIMPINHFAQLSRFSAQCGAEIPRFVQQGMKDRDAEAQRSLGINVLARLLRRLIAEGAPSLHFYTLNRAPLTLEILKAALN